MKTKSKLGFCCPARLEITLFIYYPSFFTDSLSIDNLMCHCQYLVRNSIDPFKFAQNV